MTINTINIHINLLKTRRRGNYVCRMHRQELVVTLGLDKLTILELIKSYIA